MSGFCGNCVIVRLLRIDGRLTGVFRTWTTSGPKNRHSMSMGLRLMYTPLSVVRMDCAESVKAPSRLVTSNRPRYDFIVCVTKVGLQRYKKGRMIFLPYWLFFPRVYATFAVSL